MADFELSWEAPEFEFREKTVSWYWITIIGAVLILALAVWKKNFLFGVFILIAEVLILIWGSRKPDMVVFFLTDKGLTIGEQKSYPYPEIYGFAIEDDEADEWATLILEFNKKLRPAARMSVPKDKLTDIKKILSNFVDEIEIKKSLVDSFQKFLGF
ncbi:MAG: hypothetical protein Q7R86_03335 [bacterium]|nr:hypothetical protein [bacterium]